MKNLIVMIACGLLVGCDYTVPLVKTPAREIDSAAIGLWQGQQDENLLVLPLSKVEYLVSLPAGSKDALFARACACSSSDNSLVQLEWFGTAKGKLPDGDGRIFQFAQYVITADTLSIRMLNPEVVKNTVKTSKELAKAIHDNHDNPNLFKSATVYKKVKD